MKPLNPAGLVLSALLFSGSVSAHAQSTAFTYQGRLRENTIPSMGAFDLQFALYDAPSGGTQIGSSITADDVTVANGLFCVTLDFGVNAFTGPERWLETSLRPGAETGDYTALTPRRAITATPYALYAPTAGTANSVAAVNLTGTIPLARLPSEVVLNNETDLTLSGTFTGSGAGLMSVNADLLDGQHCTFYQNAANLTAGTLSDARLSAGATSAITAVNAATEAATANAIVKRDSTGSFAAGTVTATFVGSASGLTALNADQLVTGTVPNARLSGSVPLLNANQVFIGSNVFNGASLFTGAAKMTNATNVIVGTHGGDGASLSNLTAANLTGVAPKAVDFTGTLTGDVTGTQASTVVAAVGGVTAVNVASGANAANAGTSLATANALVKRDGAAGFAAGAITASTFSGSGSGLTALNASQLTSGTLADGRLSSTTASAVSAANAATSVNTPDTIVKRDANGAFAAGTVIGTFIGDGSGLTNIQASSGGGSGSLPSGITVVSASPNDSGLIANGYRMIMRVATPAWVNAATANAPSARARHTAVWDGQRLIIWGGKITTGASYVSSGAMYHPDSDLWETVSSINAPAARANHTAVWSGMEMIIWGGDGASAWLGTGARFSPDQQSWRDVSSTGAPAGRSGHVAVWTGTHMLIWGGQNASGFLSDGALYNPVGNQWSTLTLVNGPEARARATAVWAGDRLIIWGGEGTGGVLNSGAQLVFANGSPTQWLALPDNGPAPRRGHTAIWTGQKMIVWGGEDGAMPVSGGAAFDPAANTWTALGSVGAPVPRYNHAAVWTGQEMLIVGGSTSATELASGSAYDPGSVSWWSLSSAGPPQPRAEATASWNGTELLLFGGRAQGQCLSALQRLVPQRVWYFYCKL